MKVSHRYHLQQHEETSKSRQKWKICCPGRCAQWLVSAHIPKGHGLAFYSRACTWAAGSLPTGSHVGGNQSMPLPNGINKKCKTSPVRPIKCQHQKLQEPWAGGSIGWNAVPIRQGCGFNPWSRHIREATNECGNKWDNKSVFLSLKNQFKKASTLLEKSRKGDDRRHE